MKYKTKMGLVRGGDLLAIDKELISEIKNSVNIVDVIGEVVSLTRAGRNYIGLCPFHKEKTPSFNVIEDKQFFSLFLVAENLVMFISFWKNIVRLAF